jgi:hypothetical protein
MVGSVSEFAVAIYKKKGMSTELSVHALDVDHLAFWVWRLSFRYEGQGTRMQKINREEYTYS